jgi:photosynthetic reaction center cytochrome c subunit
MLSITEWVAPEQVCAYCHNEENLADDSVYTKVVARRMLQMTKNINTQWKDHVADTGVTCYTCHRGKPVPDQTWSTNSGPRQAGGMAGSRNGQNLASDVVATTSLPYDLFSELLNKNGNIRVAAKDSLPKDHNVPIQTAEQTYGLMMNISKSLGVNCTFCHNTRQFGDWTQSPPTRVKAWHGIQMVNHANQKYLESLASVFPDNRKGTHGDVLKLNCATCHQGASKPLNGAQMLKDYVTELSAATGDD